MNNLDKFRNKLASGCCCTGVCITMSDPAVSEMLGECGYDFSWIDMEHAPLNIETAALHIMALRASGAAPLVRVPWNLHWVLKPVLDLAPAGVIIPMVNSAAEAREAVAACRYPSSGRRGCGVRRGAAYGKMPFDEYMQRSGSEPLVIIQIEHIDAVAELDEILAIPELDCICIGPADFSGSMGKVNHPEAPEIAEKIDEIARKVKAAGKYLGTATGCDPETLAVWKKRQVDWICLGSDWGAMVTAWRQNLQSSLKILQEK